MGFGRAFSGGFASGVQSGQRAKQAAATELARQDQLGFQREELSLAKAAGARAERADVRAGELSALQLQQGRAALAEQQRVVARQREFEEAASDALKSGDIEGILQKYPDKAANIQALYNTQQQVKVMQNSGVDVRRAAGQSYNAMARGDKEGAKQIVRANKAIIEGAGDPSLTVERMEQLIDEDPGQAAQMMRGLYTLSGGNEDTLLGVKGELSSFEAAKVRQKNAEIALEAEKNKREALADERDKTTDALRTQKLENEIALSDQKIVAGEQEQKEAVANQQAAFDNMNDIVNLATGLIKNTNLPDVVGGFDTLTPTFFGTSQDVLNTANRLKNLLTLENLDLMTGVLSESDIRILASAASGLNVTEKGILGSMPGIKRELQRIVDVTNKAIEAARSGGKLNGLQGPPDQTGNPTTERGGTISGTTSTGITYTVEP